MRVAYQVDYFIHVALSRHGMDESDIGELLESMRWLREQRKFMDKVKTGSTVSLIGLLLTALGSVLWQGARSMLGGK